MLIETFTNKIFSYSPSFSEAANGDTAEQGTTSQYADHIDIERKGLEKIPAIILVFLLVAASVALSVSVFTIYSPQVIPDGLYSIFAVLISAASLIYIGKACRRTRGILPVIVILALTLLVASGSTVPALIVISLLFTISYGAFLIIVTPKSKIVLLTLIPVFAFIISFLLCQFDPAVALISFLPVPAAITLACATRSSAQKDGITRVGAICATSFALGLTLVVGLGALIYVIYGNISMPILAELLDTMRSSMVDQLMSIQIPTADGTSALFTEEIATDLINSVINIIPGTLVCIINIFSFFSQTILLGTLKTALLIEKPVQKMTDFSMSVISAVVFSIAFLVALFDTNSSQSSLIGTVALNIATIFQPGLALCGINGFMRWTAGKRHGCGMTALTLGFLFISFASGTILTVLAILGALLIIFSFVKKLATSKSKDL